MILVLKLQLASSAVKYFPCPKDAHSSSQDTTVVFGKWKKAAHICFFISRLPLGVHGGWTLVAPLVWHQCLLVFVPGLCYCLNQRQGVGGGLLLPAVQGMLPLTESMREYFWGVELVFSATTQKLSTWSFCFCFEGCGGWSARSGQGYVYVVSLGPTVEAAHSWGTAFPLHPCFVPSQCFTYSEVFIKAFLYLRRVLKAVRSVCSSHSQSTCSYN